MHIAQAHIDKTYIQGWRTAHLTCPPALIPAPGQYLLAQASADAHTPLPVSITLAATTSNGFYTADPLPANWVPGTALTIKGPLGNGFRLPAPARKVLLASWSQSPGRVLALMEACQRQNAEIALIIPQIPEDIPLSIEILPLAALPEAARWADFAALDIPRDQFEVTFSNVVAQGALPNHLGYAQIFIKTPMPCGGLADCGICALHTRQGFRFACKDGPVFDLKEIISPHRR